MHKGQISFTFKYHIKIIIHFLTVYLTMSHLQFFKTLPMNSKALRNYSLKVGPVLGRLLVLVRKEG